MSFKIPSFFTVIVANVTSLLAEVNPTELTDTTAKTTLTPSEDRITTEEPGVTLTEVIVTTEQSTDAPIKAIVTTQQSVVAPNVATVTTGEYSSTPAEAIVSTEQSTNIATKAKATMDNLNEAIVTTQQSMDIATKVVATAEQSTNTPTKIVVTREPLFMDTPTEEILTTEQSTDISTEGIEPSLDMPKEAIVTTQQTTSTPNIAMVTTGESTNITTKALVTTKQSMDTPTEAIELSTDTPKEVIVTTQQSKSDVAMVAKEKSMITPTEAIVTTKQSIDIVTEAIAATEQSRVTPTEAITTTETFTDSLTQMRVKTDWSTFTVTEVIATSKQSTVTPDKAIVSTAQNTPHLTSVSSMATDLEFTVEVSAKPSFNLNTGASQGVNPDSLTEVTGQATEKMSPGTELEVNHNAPEIPLSTASVAFENGEDDVTVEGSVNSGLGKTKVDTVEALPEEPVQVGDDGVGRVALQPSPSPTLRTTFEPSEDEQPEMETLESNLPDDFLDTSLDKPPPFGSEETHDGDEVTSGSIIMEKVSGTAENLSEIISDKDSSERTEDDTHVTILQVSNDVEDIILEMDGEVTEYSVSEEKETLAGAEVSLEAPTNELSLEENTPVAEDVHAFTSAEVPFDYTVKNNTEDLPKETAKVETAVHEVPTNTMADNIAVENDKHDSAGEVEQPETNGKDVTLAFTLDPSVIILDVEDYTHRTHNMETDIKEETPEGNLLESTVEGKPPDVLEDTTSTLPEMTVSEGADTDMFKDTEVFEDTTLDVPETTPRAVVPDVTTSESPRTVERSSGILKVDDTPAPSVEIEKSTLGLNELTTNMQQMTISSTVQESTQISNNIIDGGNMVRSHCLRDYP